MLYNVYAVFLMETKRCPRTKILDIAKILGYFDPLSSTRINVKGWIKLFCGNITWFTFSPMFLKNKVTFRMADNLSSVSFHGVQKKNEGLETQGSVGQRGSQNLKSTNSSWSSASDPWGNKLITVSPYWTCKYESINAAIRSWIAAAFR